ncbi:flagellar basal body L-ring protein FlgH [Botrimarina hoheduenensis]|uniref:Flagellar L-ring protein n=1 Tax=Botrimarina hoheduenensis TaxID=2528000 RepID=A0A5C5VVR2_9BACT|nr:flagellar basal body L-ring protein FlgH [Botrimarina hoheduenensis]TWT42688.1 Flagellar L-ring protein precursor [Botrimarina hoheduenensis]
MNRFTLMAGVLIAQAIVAVAAAQDSSLLLVRPTQSANGATLQNSSFMYQALPPEAMNQPLKVESIITVLVDYRSVMQSEGNGESTKIGAFSSVLTDWIAFDGKSIFPAAQRRGDPTIAGTLNSQYRADSSIEQREALTFPIACKVVDIRPNGNLVIEGRRSIEVNEEVWVTYLMGTAPRQQIGPDLTIRDNAITDLNIRKYEEGAVRDGYSRGWLSRWYGKTKAF